MNKDALLATLIGFGLGLIITGIILVGPKISSFMPKFSFPWISFTMPKKKSPAPSSTSQSKSTALTIESPLPEAIETTSQIVVSGSTIPNATVAAQGPTDEDVIVASENGTYALKITLSEGRNDVDITSYTKDKLENKSVTVYYSQ